MAKITKAFILGAGLGTRLRPLTNVLPKPLVPVWNEPLVNHALRHCKSAGIEQFAINTHHLPEAWEKEFSTGDFEGASVELFYEPVLLETGGGIKNIAKFIGSDPILVFNGDIITDIDLEGLMEAHLNSGDVATLAVKSTGPNCNIALEGNRVVDLRHDLGVHPGTHQFTGIYCISPEILDLLPENQKVSIVPAFLELAKLGALGSFNVDTASWHDIGTIECYQAVHRDSPLADSLGNFVAKSAVVSGQAKLKNSVVWPNVTIESGADLDGCVVYSSTPVTAQHSNSLI